MTFIASIDSLHVILDIQNSYSLCRPFFLFQSINETLICKIG